MLWEQRPVAIVPKFPRSILESPSVAEFAASEILLRRLFGGDLFFQNLLKSGACPSVDDQDAYWLYRVMDAARAEQLVLRTTPLHPSDYLAFLNEDDDVGQSVMGRGKEDLRGEVESRIPKGISWLVEVSLPDLYQWNHRRVGEVIITEIPGHAERMGLWLVRLPGVLTLPTKTGDLEHFSIQGSRHYPIVQLDFSHLKRVW
jgi:hypothetical protein